MPFVKDAVGAAENRLRNSVMGQSNSVKNVVGDTERQLSNAVSKGASNAVNKGVQEAVGQAGSALSSLVRGDVSGAISSFNPGMIADSAFSGLLSGSGIALSSGGGDFAMSGSGGVSPGDALGGAQARSDPLLGCFWYCQLPIVGNTTQQGSTTSTGSSFVDAVSNFLQSNPLSGPLGGAQAGVGTSQLPWYYVEDATCPFRQYSQISIFREGRERHYPSRYSVGNLRLGLYADTRNVSLQYLQAWQATVLNPFASQYSEVLGGGWNRPTDYKRPINIYMLDPDKNVLMNIQYVECYPLDISPYALVSSSSERIIHQVDFSVGDVFINLIEVPPSLGDVVKQGITDVANAGLGLLGQGISALF